MRAKARKIPGWQQDRTGLVGLLQKSPAKSTEPEETVTLIPMGAARLRITSFPTIGTGPDATEWVAPPTAKKSAYKATASHCNDTDTEEAMGDGLEPSSSNDGSIPRFTWWPRQGTREWAQYDFGKAKKVSGASVYWFDDTGGGSCRVPASWKILWKDGDAWKPVEATGELGTKRGAYNPVGFKPVETTALRIEVQLQPGFSGGILEWKVKE
jgi:hypothetical protein